jgi:DNA repair protein RecO (recombination protein O)
MITKDLAICLRAIDYSETSQILTFFTRKTGKIPAIAKGSKRPKSGFGGPIENLACASVVFTQNPDAKLATLTEFEQKPLFLYAHANFASLNAALLAAELVNSLTTEFDPHENLFDALADFLQSLNQNKDTTQILTQLIKIQLNILREIGLAPVLTQCVNCRLPVPEQPTRYSFSPSANGLICYDCQNAFPDRTPLPNTAVNLLANPQNKILCPADDLRKVEKFLLEHFTQILRRKPKLTKYILQI